MLRLLEDEWTAPFGAAGLAPRRDGMRSANSIDGGTESRPARVVAIVDSDHLSGGIETWFAAQPGFELVARGRDGGDARDLIERVRPDIVLIDAVLPVVDGYAATREIKRAPAPPLVVLVNFHDSAAARGAAENAGADGYLAKSELGSELLRLMNGLLDSRTSTSAEEPDSEGAAGARTEP